MGMLKWLSSLGEEFLQCWTIGLDYIPLQLNLPLTHSPLSSLTHSIMSNQGTLTPRVSLVRHVRCKSDHTKDKYDVQPLKPACWQHAFSKQETEWAKPGRFTTHYRH